MTTIGEVTSRIKDTIKATKQDSFVTDRYVYSLMLKYIKLIIKREDDRNKLSKITSLFTNISYIELEECSLIDAKCTGIRTYCVMKRSVNPIKDMIEASNGPIIKSVSSLDYSIPFFRTRPEGYTSIVNSTNFKFNKNYYYWEINGYLYFPNCDWDAVRGEFLLENSEDYLQYDKTKCVPRQEQKIAIPDSYIAEAEEMIKKDLGLLFQTPSKFNEDKMSQTR